MFDDGLSPERLLQNVAEIWNAIDCDDSGATDGMALDELRGEVAEASWRKDAEVAASLTLQALLLICHRD